MRRAVETGQSQTLTVCQTWVPEKKESLVPAECNSYCLSHWDAQTARLYLPTWITDRTATPHPNFLITCPNRISDCLLC